MNPPRMPVCPSRTPHPPLPYCSGSGASCARGSGARRPRLTVLLVRTRLPVESLRPGLPSGKGRGPKSRDLTTCELLLVSSRKTSPHLSSLRPPSQDSVGAGIGDRVPKLSRGHDLVQFSGPCFQLTLISALCPPLARPPCCGLSQHPRRGCPLDAASPRFPNSSRAATSPPGEGRGHRTNWFLSFTATVSPPPSPQLTLAASVGSSRKTRSGHLSSATRRDASQRKPVPKAKMPPVQTRP